VEKKQGIEDDLNQVEALERRLPADDGAGAEIGISRLADLLATSAHVGVLLNRKAKQKT